MSFKKAIRTALYSSLRADAALTGLIGGRLLDDVEQKTAYPYVTLNHISMGEWSTGDAVGREATVTLDSWSRYSGIVETENIQTAIDNVLDRADLSHPGYRFHLCDYVDSDSFIDADGETRHGVITYRVLIERV